MSMTNDGVDYFEISRNGHEAYADVDGIDKDMFALLNNRRDGELVVTFAVWATEFGEEHCHFLLRSLLAAARAVQPRVV